MSYAKTVDGVDYISIEEREPCACKGCVAYANRFLCGQLNEYPYFDMCVDLHIIWITKKEEK